MPGRVGQTVRPQRWYDRSDSERPVQGFIVAVGASSPVRLFRLELPILELSTVTVFNAGWHDLAVLRRDRDRGPVSVALKH